VVAGVLAVAALGVLGGYALRGGDDDTSTVRAADTDPTTDSTDDATADGGDDAGAPDDANDPSTPDTEPADLAPPSPVPTDGLDPVALELANAINTASSLSYHAVYKGTGSGANGPTDVTVEIWRQLPLARRDTVLATGEGRLHTLELRLRDRLVGCIDTDDGTGEPEWVCLPSAGKGVDPAEPLLGTVRPVSGAVTVRDDTVAGVPARCFTVTSADAPVAEACFDADGIPVSIDGGDGRLERVEVGRGVDPEVIVIPPGAEERTDAGPADDAGVPTQPST
jgi:hypothetical protein